MVHGLNGSVAGKKQMDVGCLKEKGIVRKSILACSKGIPYPSIQPPQNTINRVAFKDEGEGGTATSIKKKVVHSKWLLLHAYSTPKNTDSNNEPFVYAPPTLPGRQEPWDVFSSFRLTSLLGR